MSKSRRLFSFGKLLLTVVLGISMILATTACGEKQGDGKLNRELTEAEKKYGVLYDGKPITIRVDLNNYTPTVNTEATEEDPDVFLSSGVIAEEFTKMFPNVTIEWERTKGSDWPYWMTTQVAADAAPDIVFLHGAQHADRGWFYRLNELLDEKNVFVDKYDSWKAMFPDYVWDSYMTTDAAGNILAVPYTLYAGTATAYYYNKSIFKELNITPPTEWNDFISICKKINKAGYISVAPWSANKTISTDVWDIQFSLGPSYASKIIDVWDLDKNGSMSQNELLRAAYKGEFYAKNNKAVLDMYSKVKEKYTDVLQTGAASTDYEALWNQGKVAMMEDGLWRYPTELSNTKRDFEFGIIPVPVATGQTSQYAADVEYGKGPYQPPICTSLNIVKSAVDKKGEGAKEVCARYLQWITKPENLDMVVLESHGDGIGAVYGTQIPPELNEWFQSSFPKISNCQWVTGFTNDSQRKMSKQLEMWIRGMIDDQTFLEGYDAELKSGMETLIKALNIDTTGW